MESHQEGIIAPLVSIPQVNSRLACSDAKSLLSHQGTICRMYRAVTSIVQVSSYFVMTVIRKVCAVLEESLPQVRPTFPFP